MSEDSERYRVVTPAQFDAGYQRFHKDKIPNVTRHEFKLVRYLPNGNAVVREPK